MKIYTDGGCPKNGDKEAIGGWAFVVLDQSCSHVVAGSSDYLLPNTKTPNTSIRMELIAIIEALKYVQEPQSIEIISDSAYCVNGIRQQWYKRWFATGKNSLGKEPANMDLWIELARLLEYHSVVATHVKGHSGDPFNDLVDKLATVKIEEAKYISRRR